MTTRHRTHSRRQIPQSTADKTVISPLWELSRNRRISQDKTFRPTKAGHFSLGHATDQRVTTITIPDYLSAETEIVRRGVTDRLLALDETQELWTTETENRVQFWLFTQSITHDRELEIYRMLQPARKEYPDVPIDLHIVHPGMFESDDAYPAVTLEILHEVLPVGAERLMQR